MMPHQDRLRLRASTETIRASEPTCSSFDPDRLYRSLEAVARDDKANNFRRTEGPRTKQKPSSIDLYTGRKTGRKSSNEQRDWLWPESPTKVKQQERERRLSAATIAGKKRVLSPHNRALLRPTQAVKATSPEISTVNANAVKLNFKSSKKDIKSLSSEIEKAEQKSQSTLKKSERLNWWSHFSSPTPGKDKNCAQIQSSLNYLDSFAGYVLDEPDSDNESTTPPLSPNIHGDKLKPPLSIKSILRRGPLYEPPLGLHSISKSEALSSFENFTDYRSNTYDDVAVAVRDADSSDEDPIPIYETKSEFMPPTSHMFSFPCFSNQLQLQSQPRPPEPLRSLLISPNNPHATYWDIDYSDVIDWKCHLILHDPGKHAHNLRASLRFHSNPRSKNHSSSRSAFCISFTENPGTIKASRDAHNKHGSDRDGMPFEVLNALLDPDRVTASAAWSWKDGVWTRQLCVPIPASLFSACESREFVVTGSVQYSFDICGGLFVPTVCSVGAGGMEGVDKTVSADAVAVDISVLRCERELGKEAVLVPSKPDLTGRRTNACVWPSSP